MRKVLSPVKRFVYLDEPSGWTSAHYHILSRQTVSANMSSKAVWIRPFSRRYCSSTSEKPAKEKREEPGRDSISALEQRMPFSHLSLRPSSTSKCLIGPKNAISGILKALPPFRFCQIICICQVLSGLLHLRWPLQSGHPSRLPFHPISWWFFGWH